jgi:acid phosphatase type 7
MKKTIVLLPALLLTLFACAQPKTGISFKCQPYLQNMTSDGVTVMWLADKTCTSYVLFGETEQLNQKAVASHNGQIDANIPVQKIRLSGLTPGKTYYYRAVSKKINLYRAYNVEYGDSVVSQMSSFTLPSNDLNSFTFLAFNDIHDKTSFVADVCKQNPGFNFVCYNGDILGDIYNEEQILDGLCRPFASFFGNSKPFVYTRGNHETRGPESRILNQYIDTPNGAFYYTFIWGNSCFIILDTGEDKADTASAYFGLADYDAYRTQQTEWLKTVTGSEQWKNADHRIVCGHIPISKKNDGWHGSVDLQNKFLPILNQANVDLYICGHTHEPNLEKPGKNHNFTLVTGGGPTSYENGKNTTYIKVIVSGSGLGVQLYSISGKLIDSYKIR